MSTSGVLGKYIQMPPPVTIWWRGAIAGLILYLFCRYLKYDLSIKNVKHRYLLIVGAVFLGLHWVSYFYALYYSNVALALLTLYTYPAMTTLLEPLILKTKFQPVHLLLALLILLGIYIMSPSLDLGNDKIIAIILGLVSGLTYALRNLLTKDLAVAKNGSVLMFYQLLIISILLIPVIFLLDTSRISEFWIPVSALAIITTAIGHTLIIRSFRSFSITTFSLLSSSIPILGICWAYLFLGEIPNWRTIIGGSLILLTVLIEAIRMGKTAAEE